MLSSSAEVVAAVSTESFDSINRNESIDVDDGKSLSSKDSSINTTSKGNSQGDKKTQVKQGNNKNSRQHPVTSQNNSNYQNMQYCYRGMMPPPPTHYQPQHLPYPYMMGPNSSGHMPYPPMYDPRNARYMSTAGAQIPVGMPNHPSYFVQQRGAYPNGGTNQVVNTSRYPPNFQGVQGQPANNNPSKSYSTKDESKWSKLPAGGLGQESHARKRSVDGVFEKSQYGAVSTSLTIRRSDSLSSAGSTNTNSNTIITENGGKYVRESPMKKDNIGGIAMMVSSDSKSFDVTGDRRSDSPSSASSLSLGGLSMVTLERSRHLRPLSRESDDSEMIENNTKRPKPDFKNMTNIDTITLDEGKTPVCKNTNSSKEKQVTFDPADDDRDVWKIPTSVCTIDKMKPLYTSITPAMVKNDSIPSSGSETDFSPTIDHSLSDLVPQLSWTSMVGDSPPIDDLVQWPDNDSKRNVTMDESPLSLDGSMCPLEWKDSCVDQHQRVGEKNSQPQDDPMLQLPIWSPKSFGGSSPESLTPLPYFFGNNKNSSNNNNKPVNEMDRNGHKDKDVGQRLSRPEDKSKNVPAPSNPLTPYSMAQIRPHLVESRDDTCAGREDNRVRNLRGHVPMLSPFPIYHVTPNRFPARNTDLVSPMTQMGSLMPEHLWRSPNIAIHQRPHHHSMMNSKRKCVPLKPPLPQKFQGDMEAMKSVSVPEFSNLVNFPSHMSQKQSMALPTGMRCCVMCGFACPCSMATKSKKLSSLEKSLTMPTSSQSSMDASCTGFIPGYGTIPTQNKGLCTRCDVNVWVVVATGLEIKWCKGCKNFRPWAAFGEKGLATKCVRCRERQREKYALQKEEKDLIMKGTSLDEDDM